METYALLGDGTFTRIIYGSFVPRPDGPPVQLHPIGITDRDVILSAENGCFSAYQVLSRTGLIPKGKLYRFSYQFSDEGRNLNVLGKSAGLAFALKFSQEVFRLGRKTELAYSIAATGVVENATETAKVIGIKDINSKLRAALLCLKENDIVFYPSDNENDIDQAIKDEVINRNIKLCSVSTVKQAVQKLIPPRPRKWLWLLLVILSLSLAIFIKLLCFNNGCPSYNEILTDLEEGKFFTAKQKIDIFLNDPECKDKDPKILSLYHQMNDSLGIDIKFRYFENQPSTNAAVITQQMITLKAGDGYRFDFTPNDTCFLYIYQLDTNNNLACLFPQGQQFLLKEGTTYKFPIGENWFILGYGGGTQEKLYFVTSRWRAKDLERIYSHISRSSGDENLVDYKKFQARLEVRKQAQTEIKGLFYKNYTFLHR